MLVCIAALALSATSASAECSTVGSLLGTCKEGPPKPPKPALSKAVRAERSLLTFVNDDRRAAGVGMLEVSGVGRDIAREHARAMMQRGKAFHNPELGSTRVRSRLGYPNALGENVGFGPKLGGIHGAFMRSRGHRANALAAWYGQAGIGVAYDGRNYWVVEVFLGGIGQGPRVGSVTTAHGIGRAVAPSRRASAAPSPMLPAEGPYALGVTGRPADATAERIPWLAMGLTVVGLATPGLVRFGRNRRRRAC